MRRPSVPPLLATVGLLALCGCVDQFAPVMQPQAATFAGTSDQSSRPDCPRLAMDIKVDRSPVTDIERIAGRAKPADGEDSWKTTYLRTLWIEGYVDADQMAQFEVREQQPYQPRGKPYELWRGTRDADGTLHLKEPQPSCGRAVVLAKK